MKPNAPRPLGNQCVLLQPRVVKGHRTTPDVIVDIVCWKKTAANPALFPARLLRTDFDWFSSVGKLSVVKSGHPIRQVGSLSCFTFGAIAIFSLLDMVNSAARMNVASSHGMGAYVAKCEWPPCFNRDAFILFLFPRSANCVNGAALPTIVIISHSMRSMRSATSGSCSRRGHEDSVISRIPRISHFYICRNRQHSI